MKLVLLTRWIDRQGDQSTSFDMFGQMWQLLDCYEQYIRYSKQSSRKLLDAVILQGMDPATIQRNPVESPR